MIGHVLVFSGEKQYPAQHRQDLYLSTYMYISTYLHLFSYVSTDKSIHLYVHLYLYNFIATYTYTLGATKCREYHTMAGNGWG